MHKKYNHEEIEKKWQDAWLKNKQYITNTESSKEKLYVLDMFPYPSGEGLHVGHPKGYIATDIYSRYKTMQGYEVLHPMGWDAFGLPAENFAIKNKIHPRVAVEKNIANFKEQLAELGFNYDWTKEINTTDPEFYKWTQWIFLKLFERGLAYESYEPINWCPSCQTGLANEDLESDGTCERCGSVVEKKPMRQWVLKIRDYADRMLEDLDVLDWPSHIKEAQRNWIGKSEGSEITFALVVSDAEDSGADITVFTTRADTLYGATYLVLAPEHPWVTAALTADSILKNKSEVAEYVKIAREKSEIERTNVSKEKTGVELKGVVAINPATGKQIPVFIADYVLAHYGTGAIMAVPAHDERDFAFANKFNLPIVQVIAPYTIVTGTDSPRSSENIVKFNAATAIIRHWEEELYYVVDFSPLHRGFVGGHVEPGETTIQAVEHEVIEESGYTDIRTIKPLLEHAFSRGYKTRKSREEECHDSVFLVELGSDMRTEITDHETKMGGWKTKEEILNDHCFLNNHKTFFELYIFKKPYVGDGILVNSGEFSSLQSKDAQQTIAEKVGGKMTSTYRLNDWVFSRQRYWGEPIPVVHCAVCGVVPVPESELPVLLPEVEHYAPTGTGESPLAAIASWVNTTCPKCGGAATRETNTMPQWAGSSWYYLRFADPKNDTALIDPEIEKKWLPVDVYVGGDHAVRHLIYARFWHKFLYDIGVVHTIEPFKRLEFLGFILAEDGRKMSKRWGNIINPSTVTKANGADTLRVYEMFMGPFENTIAWSADGLVGARRFLERVHGLTEHITPTETKTVTQLLHKTIAKVASDIDDFKFNTAVSALMIFLNAAEKEGVTRESYTQFLKLLAPFAPHLTEELWHVVGGSDSIHTAPWPIPNLQLLVDVDVTISVQVNGKMKGTVTVPHNALEETVLESVNNNPEISHKITGAIVKVIFVPNRIISLVVRE